MTGLQYQVTFELSLNLSTSLYTNNYLFAFTADQLYCLPFTAYEGLIWNFTDSRINLCATLLILEWT